MGGDGGAGNPWARWARGARTKGRSRGARHNTVRDDGLARARYYSRADPRTETSAQRVRERCCSFRVGSGGMWAGFNLSHKKLRARRAFRQCMHETFVGRHLSAAATRCATEYYATQHLYLVHSEPGGHVHACDAMRRQQQVLRPSSGLRTAQTTCERSQELRRASGQSPAPEQSCLRRRSSPAARC